MLMLRRILILVLLLLAGAAAAQPQQSAESLGDKIARWDSEATKIERSLEFEEQDLDRIDEMRRILEAQLAEIPAARREVQTQLQPLRDQRAALGDAPEGATAEALPITQERRRLDEEIARVEARLKRIDQAEARASALIERLTNLRRVLFTDRLMTQGPSVFDRGMVETALAALGRRASVIALETTTRLGDLDLTVSRAVAIGLGLGLLMGAVVALVRLRNYAIGALLARVRPDTPRSARVAAGAGVALARFALPLVSTSLIFGAILGSGLLGGQGEMLLIALAKGVAVVIGAYALGGAFFAPHAPLLRLPAMSNTDAICAHRWMIILAGIVGLDRALVQGGQDMGIAVEGLALLNTGLLLVGGLTLWKFLRHIRPPRIEAAPVQDEEELAEFDPEGPPARRGSFTRSAVIALRVIGWISAVTAPLLALAGYYVAARYAFFPVVFSGAVIGVCVLLYHLVYTVVDGIAAVAPGAGEAEEEGQTGETGLDRLRLIPIAVGFLLFCAALPVLALIWGASVADLGMVWRQVAAGFTLGEVTIAPLDFVIFAAIMVIGIVLNRRLRRVLRRSVLPYTGLDAGGRDAVAAGAGYVGIVIVTLLAISSTGIDLSNLAIVAGALSVGIGFGLQNIVNNFVSGIILLVERPIKAGDWIELPSGMGYVKTINVRSTEVETFDRASLFVPNSQLISENVINWTHSNLHGRVIVPVGVAHGSDPRQVERILLEIARAHPLMLRRPAPFVLFRGFTLDSLNFEIRGILRDVNWVLNVHSDINFEIARRFADEGIVLPFRQNDIRLRNAGEVGAAFGHDGAAPAAPPPQPRLAEAGGPRHHSEPAGDGDGGGAGGDGR